MEAEAPTRKHPLLAVVCAAAVLGSLLGPAQAVAGGSLTPSGSTLAYGSVGVGNSTMNSVVLTNSSTTTTIGDDNITGANASEFESDDGCDNMMLGNGGQCTIQVTFSPTSPGMKAAVLHVPNNGSPSDVMINLTGTGLSVSLTPSPAMFDFGSVAPGMQSAPQTFTATSDGDATVTVGGVTVAGANASQFQRTGGTCAMTPFNLTPTSSCTVIIAFAPTTPGAMAATLQFTSNAPDSPDTAALSGTAPAPPTTVPVQPTVPPVVPSVPPKTCKKGFKLKRGKCVRKKKKKN